MENNIETITLAGGCFWCTEAIFQRLKGVTSVLPGYSGGDIANPTYEQVCSGNTGHAEAIQIKFDSQKIKLETILEVFFATHDPTTLNQQGADIGTQYRSAIFYDSDEQKKIAEVAIKKAQTDFDKKIVTEVVSFKNFYEAEDYHKNYFEKNKSGAYCNLVIAPKIKKLLVNYSEIVKEVS